MAKAITQKNTVIGNAVWIGYKATVMPGIKIGDGEIIGSKSTVTKDVAPYSIVGGNPAQLIQKRFSKEDIDKLLELQWWDWPIEKITANVHNLTGSHLGELTKSLI